MRRSSFSMLVFAVYMGILCVAFLLFPAPFVMFFGFAPPILLVFGTFESGCAVWTGLALRRERRQPAGR
ncbi:MAG TPA: hypothetical protein VN604_01455 [Nitrospirota bacterium]|nr:hypothetical protein [Nitrospirota bacterium]